MDSGLFDLATLQRRDDDDRLQQRLFNFQLATVAIGEGDYMRAYKLLTGAMRYIDSTGRDANVRDDIAVLREVGVAEARVPKRSPDMTPPHRQGKGDYDDREHREASSHPPRVPPLLRRPERRRSPRRLHRYRQTEWRLFVDTKIDNGELSREAENWNA